MSIEFSNNSSNTKYGANTALGIAKCNSLYSQQNPWEIAYRIMNNAPFTYQISMDEFSILVFCLSIFLFSFLISLSTFEPRDFRLSSPSQAHESTDFMYSLSVQRLSFIMKLPHAENNMQTSHQSNDIEKEIFSKNTKRILNSECRKINFVFGAINNELMCTIR